MPSEPSRFTPGLGVADLGVAGLSVVVAALLLAVGLIMGLQILLLMVGAVAFACVVFLLWHLDPAYTLSFGIFLSPLAGNWHQLGFPSGADPDRLLLIFGAIQVLFRAPGMRNRPPFRLVAAHAVMAIALLYVVVSAFAVGTLFPKTSLFKIIDAFGVVPFLVFLVAPVAFRTRRQRMILLATLVTLGGYLGFTTLFEVVHLNALVFPKYILDPKYGIHFGKGRGPFVEAVTNGFACFVCAAACGVAWSVWSRPRVRATVAIIGVVCFVGAFLSQERSVWIGAAAGALLAMMSTSRLRRYVLPAIATVGLSAFVAFTAIPSVNATFNKRVNDVGTVYDRQNLAEAGLNMLRARPLTGFGWAQFQQKSQLYFQQSQNYPLGVNIDKFRIHNFLLTYAVELGLPGLLIWALAVMLGVGSAFLSRGPPDLEAWRAALVAVVTIYLVVANSVPPSLFPNLTLWVFAGVAFAGRYASSEATSAENPRSRPTNTPPGRLSARITPGPSVDPAGA